MGGKTSEALTSCRTTLRSAPPNRIFALSLAVGRGIEDVVGSNWRLGSMKLGQVTDTQDRDGAINRSALTTFISLDRLRVVGNDLDAKRFDRSDIAFLLQTFFFDDLSRRIAGRGLGQHARATAAITTAYCGKLYAQARAVFGFHLRLHACARTASRRSRHAATLRRQPAFGSPNGAHPRTSGAGSTTARSRS
jgi:hypothetical protein